MKRTGLFFIISIAFVLGAYAQGMKIPLNFERLAAKATDTIDVTLDETMLRFAGRFLSAQKSDEAQAKKLIEGLKGIHVRSFEFAKAGEYTEDDVQSLRAQLSPPGWSPALKVRSKADSENVDIFFRVENDRVTGLAIIAAEPRELTFVHIDGPIDIEQLTKLSGQFGIPKVAIDAKSKAETK